MKESFWPATRARATKMMAIKMTTIDDNDGSTHSVDDGDGGWVGGG